MTFDELSRWPDDGRRYELYDGEVSVVPSPLPLHQIVSAQLHLRLEENVRAHGGIVLYAPLDIVLTDFDVVQPDLIVFGAERAHLIHPKIVTRHAPDLAIEILSPSTVTTDRGRKKALLAKHRVLEYWLVDPMARRIEVHRLGGDDFVLAIAAGPDDIVASLVLPQLLLRPSDVIPDVQ